VSIPQSALDHLKNREGFRNKVYRDSLGYLTAGYGHKLTPEEQQEYKEGDLVDSEKLNFWFNADGQKAYDAAVSQAKQLGVEDQEFVNALFSVNFQLGENWWDSSVNPNAHKKTWQYLSEGDYTKAAEEVYDSDWAKQTPKRVDDFSNAIRNLAKNSTRDDDLFLSELQAIRDKSPTPSPGPAIADAGSYEKPVSDEPPLNPIEKLVLKQTVAGQAASAAKLGPRVIDQPAPPATWLETLDNAVKAGTDQMTADISNFGAIFDYIKGDQAAAEAKVRNADVFRASAASVLEPMGSFADFADAPTLDKFFTQVAKGIGMVTPQAIASIATGFSGAILGGVGKATLNAGAKKYVANKTNKLVNKFHLARQGKGPKLDPLEKDYLQQAYQGVSANKYYFSQKGLPLAIAKKQLDIRNKIEGVPLGQLGFWTGSGLQSLTVGSSQSLEEFRDAGYELTADEAKAALALGVPQALLDVIGEKVFYGMVFKTAAKDFVKGDMSAGEVVKSFSKAAGYGLVTSGVAEGTTEALQEEIVLQQRFAIDPTYSQEEANLRRAEAAFIGAIAGGARGAPANVMGKAYNLLFGPERQNVEDMDIGDGVPQPESPQDLNAQVKAMNAGIKPAVWIPNISIEQLGDSKIIDTTGLGEVNATEVQTTENGGSQGVLIYPNTPTGNNIAQRIQNEGATDTVLAEVLGFVETQTPDHNNVITVKDAAGNIIERQTVSDKNITKAVSSAKKRYRNNPEFTIQQQTKEQALADRDLKVRKVEEETPPTSVSPEEQIETGIDFETSQQGIGIVTSESAFTQVPDPATPGKTKDKFYAARSEQQGKPKAVEKSIIEEFLKILGGSEQAKDDVAFFTKRDITNEGKREIDDVPVSALNDYIALSKKYPTTSFRLVQSTEPSIKKPGETAKGYKIFSEGPLEADPAVVTAEALKNAETSLANKFGGTNKLNTPLAQRFKIDGKPVDITTLLENRELVQVEPGLGPQARLQAQFNELIGNLALVGKTIEYNGQPLLSLTNQQFASVNADVIAQGKVVAKRQIGEPKKTFRDPDYEDFGANRQIVETLEAAGVEVLGYKSTEDLNTPQKYRRYLDDLAARNEINIDAIEGLSDINTEPEAEGRFEPEYYIESDLRRQGLPFTQLNLNYGDNKTYLSERGKKELPLSTFGKGSIVFSNGFNTKVGDSIGKAYKNILQKLGYKRTLQFRTVDESAPNIPNFSKQNQEAYQAQLDDLKASDASARYIGFGDFDLIIIDPAKITNNASRAKAILEISHEAGHVFLEGYKSSLLGTPLGKLIYKDFEKAQKRLEETGSNKYSDPDKGFDEYFADQFAIAVRKIAEDPKYKATNRAEVYFKNLVTKLKTFFDQVIDTLYKNRLSQELLNPRFEEFIGGVLKSVEAKQDPLTLAQKYQIVEEAQNVVENMKKFGLDKKTMRYFKNKAIEMLSADFTFMPADKKHWSVSYLLRPAYGYLKDISQELASVFYSRSVSEDSPAYLNRRPIVTNQKRNEVLDLKVNGQFIFRTDGKLDLDKFNEAAKIAEDDTIATADITDPNAKALREWLDKFYDEYIGPSGIDIGKQTNFFTRQWDFNKLIHKPEARAVLVELLRQANPDVKNPRLYGKDFDGWDSFVNTWLSNDESLDTTKLSVGLSSERQKYFNNINNKDARDAELLLEPGNALFQYIDNTVKKVEYHKNVTTKLTAEDIANPALKEILPKTAQPGDVVNAHVASEVMVNRIKDPIKKQGARHAVENMLGKTGHDMSPLMRKLNSYGLLLNMVTLLPLATIASIPDLGGPMLRSKGMLGWKDSFAEIQYYMKNKEQAEQFARDLGLVTHDSIHTMYVNAYELGFMTEGSKAVADKFFSGIGLDWYTKFTRTFAAGMGQRFLINLAQTNDARSNQSLKELGLTRQDVINAYDKKTGQLDISNAKVADALSRFVEESIIRPNAAERPTWASNPYTALIFQLKSFFYAFGTNIMGGLLRQAQNGYNSKGIPSAAYPLLLGASVLLPLAAVGLELREFIKYLGRGLTPGFLERPLRGVKVEDTFGYTTAFRTDGMPWGEYTLELFDRAGYFGPFGMLFPMADNPKFGDAWFTPAFGPTAERLEDLLIDGEFRFNDIYPF
jgi:GH24 family phage-related lysozyme (muramidase)